MQQRDDDTADSQTRDIDYKKLYQLTLQRFTAGVRICPESIPDEITDYRAGKRYGLGELKRNLKKFG